jgi:VWFA-related protein
MKTLILAVLLTLPAPAVRAQSVSPAPPSASQTILDVVVTNKNGLVRDLGPKDFKLSINGKEQAIDSAVQLGAASWPQRPNQRFLTLLFDSGAIAISDGNLLRERLSRFFDAAAKPDHYLAVTIWSNGAMRVAQPFTTDPALLKTSLDAVLQSIALESSATPVATSSTPPASSGSPAAATSPMSATTASSASSTPARRSGMSSVSAGDDQIIESRRLLESLPDIAGALGSIRGRKAVLFYTGGRTYTRETSVYIDNAVEAFNKANVVVYGVTDDPSFANTVVAPTGGSMVEMTRATPEALVKIADEQDAYYSLVITPAAGLGPGCSKVQVKLAPGGLDARFSKQICFESANDPLAGQPAEKELEARASGSAPGGMSVAMRLPHFHNGPNRARVNVAAEIVPVGMKFRKDKGRFAGELDVVGVSTREDGAPGPRFSDAVQLAFDTEQQVAAFLKAPYHYEKQVEFPAGRYTVRVAFGSGAEFGRAQASLDIAPWTPSEPAVIGLTIGKRRRAESSGLTAAVPPALLEGAIPLTYKGSQIVPSGAVRFSAADPHVVYAEFQAPGGDPKQAGSLTLNARVVDVKSGAAVYDSGPVPSSRYALPESAVVPIVLELPVKLSPGAYRLEMSAQSGAGKSVRTVDYEVN